MADKAKQKKAEKKPSVALSQLKAETEECRKMRDEYLAGWKRAKADFLNYQKGEEERRKQEREYIRQDLILSMLDIYENLERAVEHNPEQGVLQIKNQFWNVLKDNGLEEIEAENKRFNPERHEAVEEIEQKDAGQGMIAEVVQKGYLLNGRVLRPSKVKVVK